MLNIALVGCGRIGEEHAKAVRFVPDCKLSSTCDNEPLMARQMAERFEAASHHSDVDELLASARPHVVHITTPPQSHYSLAKKCMEAGCHVFVEKPFTMDGDEARELIAIAERTGRKLTVGHNQQFFPAAIRARKMIADGFLGGPPVHLESTFCYAIKGNRYAEALLADRQHWVRHLPGKLLQNLISHGVARVAEYLESDDAEVVAHGGISPFLLSRGETEIVDELRSMIIDGSGHTAYFTMSTGIKPERHELRVFGPKRYLAIDYVHQTLIAGGFKNKSYANAFIPPLRYGFQHLGNSWRNLRDFAKNEFHVDTGRRRLIAAFYNAITTGSAVPIPYREILLTTAIMDRIFDQTRKAGGQEPNTSNGAEDRADTRSPVHVEP